MNDPPDHTARVERGELVVADRDHGAEVLLEHILVLAQAPCRCRGTARPAARGPRGWLVVDDLGLVLGGDA